MCTLSILPIERKCRLCAPAQDVDTICPRHPPRFKLSPPKAHVPFEHNHIRSVNRPQVIMVRGSELDVAVRASIVSLRFGAGLKSVEIAEKLNLDPGTVRTTCHRMKRAAKSEDLLELLKHCRTKKRSGRPSMKNAATTAAAVTADKASSSSPATVDDQDNNNQQQPEPEHEALASTASISPDPLAENFETTAWPERDLTATADTNTTTHLQPDPPLAQFHIPLPSDTLPYTTLDPQLSAPRTPETRQPHQWPPRKT